MREMEDCWPSGVGLSGAGVKPPCAALAEDRRGERQGKRCGLIASGGDQEDVPEHPEGFVGVAVEALLSIKWRRNRGPLARPRDGPGGYPCYWPGGVRCGGGVSLVCGSRAEHGKASVDTDGQSKWAVVGSPGCERERAEAETEGTEYRCGACWRTGS